MDQNLSRALLGRYRSINNFASRICNLRDGRRNGVAQREATVSHTVHLGRRIGADAQYVGYGVPRKKWRR